MPKRKEEEIFAPLGKKENWHAYSLQMLNTTKFTIVVGEILKEIGRASCRERV